MMICINVTEFVLVKLLEKDHSMIERRRLKNIVIFIQTILYEIVVTLSEKVLISFFENLNSQVSN